MKTARSNSAEFEVDWMGDFILEQLYIFFAATYGGMLIGFIYDLYRVFRGVFKPGKIATVIQDFFFWIVIAGVAMFVLLFSASGQIRFFSFLGFSLGMLLYYWTFSNIVIRTIRKVLRIIYKGIGKIVKTICYPFGLAKKQIKKMVLEIKVKLAWVPKIYHRLRNLPKKTFKKAKRYIMKILKKK
ncbi:spore cortex biosynthesis protein YabQ [Geosporobacter ferrireducens]|nr:spore cortex biosynthesis protein YabQ [Geosporobacter ferrireducens]